MMAGAPSTSTVEPGEWFRRFTSRYNESAEDTSSELGIYYERHRHNAEFQQSAASALVEYTNTEWFDVMAAFFSGLAREFGMYQTWEWQGRSDLAWLRPGTEWELQALVVQEDEALDSILTNEVPALARSGARLGVLVMYPDHPSPTGAVDLDDATRIWVERIGAKLAEQDASAPFLLLTIGSNCWDVPAPWQGFHWDPAGKSLLRVTDDSD